MSVIFSIEHLVVDMIGWKVIMYSYVSFVMFLKLFFTLLEGDEEICKKIVI